MKKITIMLILILFMASCDLFNYNEQVHKSINNLESPVILIGKRPSSHSYGITVRDANGVIMSYGNMSIFANHIGESMNIGDTIR